jgi:hypothetical protein
MLYMPDIEQFHNEIILLSVSLVPISLCFVQRRRMNKIRVSNQQVGVGEKRNEVSPGVLYDSAAATPTAHSELTHTLVPFRDG